MPSSKSGKPARVINTWRTEYVTCQTPPIFIAYLWQSSLRSNFGAFDSSSYFYEFYIDIPCSRKMTPIFYLFMSFRKLNSPAERKDAWILL